MTPLRRPAVRRPAAPRDSGITLVETMVALSIATVVMGAAATISTAALATNRASMTRVQAVNDARVSVAAVDRTLRAAIRPVQLGVTASTEPAFLEATLTRVRFYADIDNPGDAVGPSRVTYDTNGGTLVQTIQKPLTPITPSSGFTYCDETLSSCAVQRAVLATGLRSTSGFAYYGSDGVAIPVPSGGLDLTTRGLVNGVDISVSLAGSGSSGPTSLTTRVELVNQDAYRLGTP